MPPKKPLPLPPCASVAAYMEHKSQAITGCAQAPARITEITDFINSKVAREPQGFPHQVWLVENHGPEPGEHLEQLESGHNLLDTQGVSEDEREPEHIIS